MSNHNELLLMEVRHKTFNLFFVICFGGLQCAGHFFSYVAHFVFLRDVYRFEPGEQTGALPVIIVN
jgi:hypothetical protein